MWAAASGASVIFPKEVLVDTEWKPNPCTIRDPGNRRILCVTARAVAWRLTDKGLPQVCDWTHNFDTPSYRLIDLLGKAKKYPQAFRLLPSDMGKPDFPGTWARYPFDESTDLYVNTAHEEAITWFAQILNREKKAIDFAQTFARRNALKHLSALQRAPGNRWSFPVICWRTTGGNVIKWDHTQYAMLQDKAGGLANASGEDFGCKLLTSNSRVEVIMGSDRASDDEELQAMENHVDTEDRQADFIDIEPEGTLEPACEVPPVPEPKPAVPSNPEEMKILRQYQEAKAQFPGEFAQACKKLGLDPAKEHGVTAASAIVVQIGKIIDQG